MARILGRITPEYVRERVTLIGCNAGDSEAAHSLEDDLFADLLRAIADGRCDDPAACAREALRSLDLTFERWCA